MVFVQLKEEHVARYKGSHSRIEESYTVSKGAVGQVVDSRYGDYVIQFGGLSFQTQLRRWAP